MDYRNWVDQVSKDGYCTMPGFFNPAETQALRTELEGMLDEDVEYRRTRNVEAADNTRDGVPYSLTSHMHTMLFPAFQSKRMAGSIEKIISNPSIVKFLQELVGENYRLRVDLVRRASGIDDSVDEFQIPHEWHRDTPGEFTFGIFLDDMREEFSGGTAVIEGGTHFQPYDPIWDFMFGKRSYTNKANYLANRAVFVDDRCRKLDLLNRMAKNRLMNRTVEIRGAAGDVYFFLNDAWHGRAPNKTGKQFMTIRFGGFPTDFAFKDDLPLPKGAESLPPELQKRYSANQPVNTRKGLVIHQGRSAKPDLLLKLAHWEKQQAIRCTEGKWKIASTLGLTKKAG
jgi:phytanoyl-CoA dioxygenase PhyH